MSKAESKGRSQVRVDGPAKVTGKAQYASDISAPEISHAYVLSSGIAKGWIRSMELGAALDVPGVIKILNHENRPKTAWFDRQYRDQDSPKGSPFRPLASKDILFSGQPIALIIANSLETARYAASLIAVDYGTEVPVTSLESQKNEAFAPGKAKMGFEVPKPRGDFSKAWAQAPVTIEADYTTPMEHHNPMEPHASTVLWDVDDHLTIYDKTQGVQNTQTYVCNVFGLKKEQVRILAPFVGGAFGSGLRPQYQLFLAVMAALDLQRSVKLSLTRQQMFTFGHRPRSLQTVKLGADKDGHLLAISHEVVSETSRFEDYVEQIAGPSGQLYQCDNVQLDHKIARLDTYTPLDMRAPGAVSGIFALESAMDELAVALRIDPLELRRINYADRDQAHDKDFSSKELRACYTQGAERFGWARRTPEPRSMRAGQKLLGWGMASAMWESPQYPASARAVFSADGMLTVSSATADFGTGTYTIMSQIAAEELGLPIDKVRFRLGDSSLAKAPLSGGSFTAASVGSAVKAVCEKLRKHLFALAAESEGTPFYKRDYAEATFANEGLSLANGPEVSLVSILRAHDLGMVAEESISLPNIVKQNPYSRATHAAVFVEVEVDEDLGTISVTRMVSAIAGGRILNQLTARSQILGGMVWGISMALHEHSVLDHKLGRFMNHDFAEYHIPVEADIHELEVIFVDEDDSIVNPLGVKGLGEIGIIGVAPAIANAIYHASGHRIRQLPITLDRLL